MPTFMILGGGAWKNQTPEEPTPVYAPAEPIADMSHATLALVTTGGIVPKGNPDHIPSNGANYYCVYDISGVNDLTNETHETAHGGYDPVSANADPDRVLPVDSMRDLEREGEIGALYNAFYSTVGNGMPIANAKIFGAEIGAALKNAGVGGAIVTATCGTCSRAAAGLCREIEKAGLPAAIICTITPIAQTVGAWRIVAGNGIAHPLGNPILELSEEKTMRKQILQKALTALKTAVTEPTIFE